MNNGSPIFMIAVKNYGASAGNISLFKCNRNLADYDLGPDSRLLLQGIEGTTLMPGQKVISAIDYHAMRDAKVDELTFTVGYSCGRK